MEPFEYDGIIVITASDLERVKSLLPKMKAHMPVRNLIFIGSEGVGNIVSSLNSSDYLFINENAIIKFSDVNDILKKLLGIDDVPRGITGWYYQQFLKMGYSNICKDEYYLIWDGDTIPCGDFSMFHKETGKPYLDIKNEYNEEYFITMNKLLPGFHKVIEKSFIAEHMLFNRDIMRKMIEAIESNEKIEGKPFFEKILNSVRPDKIRAGGFSEFETYGTFVAMTDCNAYRLRDWHSLRFGSFFFKADEITDEDFLWLKQDFEAVSFEKDEEYLPDYAVFFHDSKYRANLRPRQIVEAIWEEGAITSNVVEKW